MSTLLQFQVVWNGSQHTLLCGMIKSTRNISSPLPTPVAHKWLKSVYESCLCCFSVAVILILLNFKSKNDFCLGLKIFSFICHNFSRQRSFLGQQASCFSGKCIWKCLLYVSHFIHASMCYCSGREIWYRRIWSTLVQLMACSCQHQAITWTSVDLLVIRLLETYFNRIAFEI